MTVQDAVRMWSRHDADVQSEDGKKNRATIRETYQIICDPTDSLIDVSGAGALPLRGDPYVAGSQVRVKSRKFSQVSPVFWTCAITYDGEFGLSLQDSPLNQPPQIEYGKIDSEEAIDQDADGSPIVTVNNEPIDGVTKPISDLTCTITRNYAAIDLNSTQQYFDSVNSDTFLDFDAGRVHLTQFNAKNQWDEDAGGYFTVTAGFTIRYPYNTTSEKAWYRRVLHQGWYEKTSGGDIRRARDDEGMEVSRPVLLKSDGTRETNPANAHWLEFPIFTPLPYNALGLI